MTVSQLMDRLSTLNPELKVVIGVGDSLEDICFEDSGIIQVEFNDSGDKENLFMLAPCYCDLEDEIDEDENEINSRPELN